MKFLQVPLLHLYKENILTICLEIKRGEQKTKRKEVKTKKTKGREKEMKEKRLVWTQGENGARDVSDGKEEQMWEGSKGLFAPSK